MKAKYVNPFTDFGFKKQCIKSGLINEMTPGMINSVLLFKHSGTTGGAQELSFTHFQKGGKEDKTLIGIHRAGATRRIIIRKIFTTSS